MELREARPSYVEFEVMQEEDREQTELLGHYVARDVDYAIVTPVGSKDKIPRKVSDWFPQLEQQTREERIPPNWLSAYKAKYAAWKEGLEIPVDGTPIKGWPMLSPAQQTNVIGANIRTVEDLAEIGDEPQRRIGMGALDLKNKAKNWLQSAKSIGVSAAALSAQQIKLDSLASRLTALEDDKVKLQAEVNRLKQYEPKTKAA